MPFTKGRISFIPLVIKGGDLPSTSEIEAIIVKKGYRPLKEDEVGHTSFVSASAEVPEEFQQSFENPCPSRCVIAGLLHEYRKIDMKIVRNRVKRELEKIKKKSNLYKPGMGVNQPTKEEVREAIIEEEMKKAPIVSQMCEVCFDPDNNTVLVGTRSMAAVERLILMIKQDIMGLEQDAEVLIVNPLIDAWANLQVPKIIPFAMQVDQGTVPEDAPSFLREFLTWLLISMLDDCETECGVSDYAKIVYEFSPSIEEGRLKGKTSEPVEAFAAFSAMRGGLVDEFILHVSDGRVWSKTGIDVKITSSGVVADIKCPFDKKQRANDLDYVCDGAVGMLQFLVDKMEEFAKLRVNLDAWTKACARLKKIASACAAGSEVPIG